MLSCMCASMSAGENISWNENMETDALNVFFLINVQARLDWNVPARDFK